MSIIRDCEICSAFCHHRPQKCNGGPVLGVFGKTRDGKTTPHICVRKDDHLHLACDTCRQVRMYEMGGTVKSVGYNLDGSKIGLPAPAPPTPTRRPPPSDTEVPLTEGTYRSPPAQATVPDDDVEDPRPSDTAPVRWWTREVKLPIWAFVVLALANLFGPVLSWLFKEFL